VPILAGGQPPPPPPTSQPLLPQIIVEAGLIPSSPVDGPGTFILNDPVNGRLDTNVLGATTIWTDISVYVLAFTVSRPSTRLQGPLFQFQAGTANITLDNSDARFDPDNLNGPYVTAGLTRLVPMVPVRVRAVWNGVTYPLFSGFADGWAETAVDYEAGYSEVTLSATDVFKVLGGLNLPAINAPAGASETSGARITRILNAARWYTSADKRTIAAGITLVQATAFGDTAKNLMHIASDSEVGLLFAGPTGAVVFRDRKALTTLSQSVNVQAVFGDSGAAPELPYAMVARADDDTALANDIQAQCVGGTLQEVTDPASITRYLFPRTYSRSDLILLSDADTAVWAQWLLFVSKTAENRFESLTVDPLAQPQDLWPQVLGRDFGDRIQVTKRPQVPALPVPADNLIDQAGSGITDQAGTGIASELPTTVPQTLTITKAEFITGISHAFDARTSAWATTWTLADASKYGSGPPPGGGIFHLSDPVLGRLDINVLSP
jgi:hypothetical protein